MSHICEKCGKEFQTLRGLCGHQAHCGIEKVECPICHNMFSKYALNEHMEFCKKENHCLYCGKKIPANMKFCDSSCAAKYNNHKRKKPVVCLNCGKEFDRKGSQKFCSQKCATEHFFKEQDKVFLEGKLICNSTLKQHLLLYKEYKCEICGLGGEWQGKPMVLILDHINGNPTDNRLENLRFVCPNCNSQLPTFAGRNKGNGRFYRRQRYKEGKSS